MKPPQKKPAANIKNPGIDLGSFEKFIAHAWIAPLIQRYEHDAALAGAAVTRILDDLYKYNGEYSARYQQVLFTAVEGRVKAQVSFLRKLHALCVKHGQARGITPHSLNTLYDDIKDLAGVRFSCPYFDEVKTAVEGVRARFKNLGYATDLQADSQYRDRDELDAGDALGYRSYHFLVRVPTPVDIYGNVELCLCEVQARTELQHVWAVKSHNLLYKPERGLDLSDANVVEDMKQVSNSLRAADQFLVSIRDRASKRSGH